VITTTVLLIQTDVSPGQWRKEAHTKLSVAQNAWRTTH